MYTASQAMQKLLEGNKRFYKNKTSHRISEEAATDTADHIPFAIVLGCSDSRVPIAIVFDQGVGDLFVIRVAGNVLDDLILASIELAVRNFNVPLVMVLGHTSCRAVEVTLDGKNGGKYIGLVADKIKPLIPKEPVDDIANFVIEENVRHVRKLIATEINGPKVVGCIYDIKGKRVKEISP